MRLILLCGLPGSGKTTLAKALASTRPAIRLCPDEWLAALGVDLFDEPFRARLEAVFQQHAWALLAQGLTVVLENGFWSRAERKEVLRGGRALGAEVELRFLDVPIEELARRLEARARQPGAVLITRSMLEGYAALFEAPDAAELALFDPIRD
ncbi:AAA family ATPase [Umezawaea endophytica]|uniref:ATP-binding protein n=1 Tax=Umezawaea endophytica TaxID=1654476 RepID=A0A9X2VRS1_9PSEU|nr:ATP-binding protein [Umezawaea endophytica]MCS7481459.1 ATP-binding protein [Umezawaea endophytica]